MCYEKKIPPARPEGSFFLHYAFLPDLLLSLCVPLQNVEEIRDDASRRFYVHVIRDPRIEKHLRLGGEILVGIPEDQSQWDLGE